MRPMKTRYKKNIRTLKRKRGFTLIELLVSITIITFLLLGTAHSIVFSLNAERRSSIKIWATELALAKIEDLKSISFDHPQMNNGSYSDTVAVNHSKEVYQRKWTISDLSEVGKNVEIECRAINEDTILINFAVIISKELGF